MSLPRVLCPTRVVPDAGPPCGGCPACGTTGFLLHDRVPYRIHTEAGTPMRFVSVRELRGQSAAVWKALAKEKDLIVTSNGKPIALLSATFG